MFLKGFMCGWIGFAAIICFLLWGMTPHRADGSFSADPSYELGYYQDC